MNWISVNDRYPEMGMFDSDGLSRSVIVSDGLTSAEAKYDYRNHKWVFEDPTRDLEEITHWIVLELPDQV